METDQIEESVTDQPPKAKKVRKTIGKTTDKADYAGLEVKKGTTGRLVKPRHSGPKIRARDKGKLVRENQINKITKRKKRMALLGADNKSKKEKQENVGKKKTFEPDANFDKLVAAYKNKISAKL